MKMHHQQGHLAISLHQDLLLNLVQDCIYCCRSDTPTPQSR
ncbi:hypothetical protein HanPSC8_Chr14g0614791 [Helianthus annuus]|nr:hypothetical protein HanPSC8_Chr14g0614791 [Helianthus annuus]